MTVGELHVRGLAALAYEIQTYKNLICGLFGQIYMYKNLHQRKFPTLRYCLMEYLYCKHLWTSIAGPDSEVPQCLKYGGVPTQMGSDK